MSRPAAPEPTAQATHEMKAYPVTLVSHRLGETHLMLGEFRAVEIQASSARHAPRIRLTPYASLSTVYAARPTRKVSTA